MKRKFYIAGEIAFCEYRESYTYLACLELARNLVMCHMSAWTLFLCHPQADGRLRLGAICTGRDHESIDRRIVVALDIC